MNNNQQWGRKETIVWPPHAPIYTFSALAFGVFATLFFVWQFLRFTETPLRRTYTPTYIQSLVGATLRQHGKYRLLYVGGGKAAPRLALLADFVPGETRLPNGAVLPVELSEAARHQGHTVFYRGPEKEYNDAALSRWLAWPCGRQPAPSAYPRRGPGSRVVCDGMGGQARGLDLPYVHGS
jgi:hypothetical protein